MNGFIYDTKFSSECMMNRFWLEYDYNPDTKECKVYIHPIFKVSESISYVFSSSKLLSFVFSDVEPNEIYEDLEDTFSAALKVRIDIEGNHIYSIFMGKFNTHFMITNEITSDSINFYFKPSSGWFCKYSIKINNWYNATGDKYEYKDKETSIASTKFIVNNIHRYSGDSAIYEMVSEDA